MNELLIFHWVQYGEQLQRLYTSVDEMEQLLKQISKHLQMLVSDLSAEEVAAMSNALKREKVPLKLIEFTSINLLKYTNLLNH